MKSTIKIDSSLPLAEQIRRAGQKLRRRRPALMKTVNFAIRNNENPTAYKGVLGARLMSMEPEGSKIKLEYEIYKVGV